MVKRLELGIKKVFCQILNLVLQNKHVAIPLNVHNMKKILIFRYDRLGDMVVTTPVFEVIHQNLPQVELHILASPKNEGLLTHDDRITKVYSWDNSVRSLMRLLPHLRRERYDCILPLMFVGKTTLTGILANSIGGRRAIKTVIYHHDRLDIYKALYNAHVPFTFTGETMAELLVRYVCSVFGWDYHQNTPRTYTIRFNETHRNRIIMWLTSQNVGVGEALLVNLSAGKNFCQWSEKRHVEFFEQLCSSGYSQPIILNVAPSDRKFAECIIQRFPDIKLLPATNDPLDLAACIKCMKYVITPDTSIVHFASAYSVPLVAYYSRLSFGNDWLPFGNFPYKVVITNDEEPVETIEPQSVINAFQQLRCQLPND